MNQSLSQRIQLLRAKLMRVSRRPLKPTLEQVLSVHLPLDYRTFLIEIGSGEIGDMQFVIYPTPLKAREIYGSDIPSSLERIFLFGDDFNGMCVGFDPTNVWRVVEVDKNSHALEVLANSFIDFVEGDWRLAALAEE